ncbi:MAG: type III pantothenate kinase [Desulfovibrio sp.]|nr:type III pantothenate kinase [Desulfovibrio sp.]
MPMVAKKPHIYKNEVLLIDVGNTSTKIALSRSEAFIWQKSWPTTAITSHLLAEVIAMHQSQTVFCCSVVPTISDIISQTLVLFPQCSTMFVGRERKVPLKINYQTPDTLGADRLVAAYAARRLFSDPALLVIDAGTALTLDLVISDTFFGGFILASPTGQMEALGKAAQLPNLTLPKQIPEFSLGQSTATCITHGALFGTVAMLNGLIAKIEHTYDLHTVTIGTGGMSSTLSAAGFTFTHLQRDLVLDGLRFLAYQ